LEIGLAQKDQYSVPAYQQIHDSIQCRIDAGELTPGEAVDSERELAKIHGVSLMTARHALASLERSGLVERRRGVGTFVSSPRIQINKLMSTTEQLARQGLVARSKVLLACVVYDEQEIATKLALPLGSGILKLMRLRHSADEPFSLETCYLSASDFPKLLSAPLSRESLFKTLERKYKVSLGHADEEIDAIAADAKTAELLDIPMRSPVLRIRQVIYSTQKRPLMYVSGFYRSDRHRLVIRRFRESV
jgi:GntR family transcriptional regulator